MIKLFCDICKKEVDDTSRIREQVNISEGATMIFEVITGINGLANTGHFHKKCIAEIIGNFYEGK